MEIIIKENEKVHFDTLKVGQTFIDPEYDDCDVLMVVGTTPDVKLSTDRNDGAEYGGYAVDLSNGMILGYGTAEQVFPVVSTLTAERL